MTQATLSTPHSALVTVEQTQISARRDPLHLDVLPA